MHVLKVLDIGTTQDVDSQLQQGMLVNFALLHGIG